LITNNNTKRIKLKKALFILLALSLFLTLGACSKKQEYSQSELVEIYARVELESVEKSVSMVEKYGLSNEKKRDSYYNTLREMATDKEKWEKFLGQVEEFRDNHLAKEK